MRVSYSRSQLTDLGNFENVRYEVSVEDDVVWENEDNDACYTRLKEFVDKKIVSLISSHSDKVKPDEEVHSAILDRVRESIKTLIGRDVSNRKVVAEALKGFGVNKITMLDELEIKEFDIKLKRLLT